MCRGQGSVTSPAGDRNTATYPQEVCSLGVTRQLHGPRVLQLRDERAPRLLQLHDTDAHTKPQRERGIVAEGCKVHKSEASVSCVSLCGGQGAMRWPAHANNISSLQEKKREG